MVPKRPVLEGVDLAHIFDKHLPQNLDGLPEVLDLLEDSEQRIKKFRAECAIEYENALLQTARTKGYTAATGGDVSLIELRNRLATREVDLIAETQKAVLELLESEFVIRLRDRQ